MGRGLWQVGKGCFSLWSDFDKQLVIADDGEEGPVTEQAVFSEHFAGTDASGTAQLFRHMELIDLASSMVQEEQRYVREGFSSDEELSLYDLLFSQNLSKQDIKQIKQVAVDLLAKVKTKIAELDHWTDKQETKAAVDNLIRDTLWAELPESYDEISISGYRQKIYEYVYTRYPDVA